jgi:hypothetical protein
MRVNVFQREGLGKHIVEGLKKHSNIDVESFTVEEGLPEISTILGIFWTLILKQI